MRDRLFGHLKSCGLCRIFRGGVRMPLQSIRRSLTVRNPVGWIVLGVAVALAARPVRRALREATVSAAVGALKLSDTLRGATDSARVEVRELLDDAQTRRDHWRKKARRTDDRPWMRKAIVNGLASALTTVEGVTQGTAGWFSKLRVIGNAEVGAIGEDATSGGPAEESENASFPDNPHASPEPPLQTTALSWRAQEHMQPAHTAASDYAVKSTEALMSFARDVKGVGAELKPEYRDVIERAQQDGEME